MRSGYKQRAPEWAGRIRSLRERLQLSQTGLADKLGVSAMAVSRWERGVNEPPADGYITLGKLAGKQGCWYFWGRAGLSKAELTAHMDGRE